MTGIAKKNENSVATARGKPNSIPPIIVAPEREVPGINAAHWARPIFRASMGVSSSTLLIFFILLDRVCRYSAQKIMNAPTIKALATGTGENKYALMYLPNRSPKPIAGTQAMTTCNTNFWDCLLVHKVLVTFRRRWRYSQHTAKIAPNWIMISKALPRSSLKFSRSPTKIKCPVLEMGKNSVRPSTTPKMRALNNSNESMGINTKAFVSKTY